MVKTIYIYYLFFLNGNHSTYDDLYIHIHIFGNGNHSTYDGLMVSLMVKICGLMVVKLMMSTLD